MEINDVLTKAIEEKTEERIKEIMNDRVETYIGDKVEDFLKPFLESIFSKKSVLKEIEEKVISELEGWDFSEVLNTYFENHEEVLENTIDNMDDFEETLRGQIKDNIENWDLEELIGDSGVEKLQEKAAEALLKRLER